MSEITGTHEFGHEHDLPITTESGGFIDVTAEFQISMDNAGLEHLPSVPISKKLDRTVRFIGAPISVMKPMLLEGEIPDNGVYMIQNCIRTANIKSLFNLAELPQYGSFFTAMCAVTKYEDLTRLFSEASTYMTEKLNVEPTDIFISASSNNSDLVDSARESGIVETRVDTQPASMYEHTYGIDGVRGRNISYWMRNKNDDTFEDIGNIIVIENEHEQLGVELALGDTTLVKQIEGLRHVQDAYDLNIVRLEAPEAIRRKIEDVAVTSLALYSEGLRPGARDNQTRILRTYMKAVTLYQKLLNIDISDFRDGISRLEQGVLPFESVGQSDYMIDWMLEYGKTLESKLTSNREDEIILNILGSTALRDGILVPK